VALVVAHEEAQQRLVVAIAQARFEPLSRLERHATDALAVGAQPRRSLREAGSGISGREAETGVGHRGPSLSGVERITDAPTPVDGQLLADKPNILHGFDLGLLAGLGFALVYGVSAEVLGLTWGLAAVGFIGGIVIGGAVTRGAWGRRPHVTVRRLQVTAMLISIGSWLLGLFAAYVFSQALLPQASTGLLERLTFSGFAAYFSGLFDFLRVAHAAALAAVAFMAWRGGR
jgi:hypothetical protein